MTTDLAYEALPRLLVAALGGLAVGVEREWSARAAGGVRRFAGVRTFLLIGLVAGTAAAVSGSGAAEAGLLLLGAIALLVVASFTVHALAGDLDATTEVAALAVLGAGWLSGSGRIVLGSALAALTALVLAEKTKIHGLVEKLRSEEVGAGAHFAVLALVVLPILPAGPFGPSPGLRPQELWALVLIVSGIGFVGYIAVRWAGPSKGWGLAGLLGGLVSSTGVTLSFSRESRSPGAAQGPLAVGVVAACALVPFRVAILASLLSPAIGREVLPLLALPMAAGLAAIFLLRRRPTEPATATGPGNPLRLGSALQLTAAFQVVLYAVDAARTAFGSQGVLLSSALAGLATVDALIYSMYKLGQGPAEAFLAARALAVGVLANTLLKLALAVALGAGPYRRLAGAGLAALAVACLAGLVLF
ncbi:MAG: DUF4010 domain-containing protein [Thermoanaerobaculia bacterium]|nr:DUF4010 domain-containing protein [Thermoanaerobaculia bacterium]